MKKLILSLTIASMLLFGCTSADTKKEQTKVYNGFKESLLNNGDLISSYIPFNYHIQVNKENEKYKYTVTIDTPQVAMNSIQMMILNPSDMKDNFESPTLGVFDEVIYHMIPNQSNKASGFVKKMELSGVSRENDFTVYALVSWKNNSQLTKYQAYFSFTIVNGEEVKVGKLYE